MPIPLGADAGAHFARADIIVSGLEHGGPSYEVRIFLDNPNATAETRQTASDGYAGSINVYGYGEPPPRGPNDPGEVRVRPARSIVATEAVRAQASRGGEVTVTLVPIARSDADVIDLDSEDVCVRIEEGATAA
ncbi:MAG: hypothetical protein QOH12_308 [Solirubrobacteraceae bacterium]|nr:hypothetical protein [Solirubrobacteraceae bacterium]